MIDVLNIEELSFMERSSLPDSIKAATGNWFVYLNNLAYGRYETYDAALQAAQDLQGWFS